MDLKNLWDIKSNFLSELEAAKSGKLSSLSYIIHETPSSSLVKEGEKFQVIVVGGTNVISAKVQKKGNVSDIISQESSILPTLVNKEDFMLFMEHTIKPDVRVIALNFAFPVTPVFERGRLDGKLFRGVKGHTFRGLVGSKIGQEVEKFILQKMQKEIVVSLANDTICLLLSGVEKIDPDRLAAGVIGSGVNFAIYMDKKTLINLEAGNFDKFLQSETGKMIDNESANPGKMLVEKEVSGVYLYKHFNMRLRADGLSHPSISSTEELDIILRNDSGEAGKLARELMERSANLSACEIAGIMEFKKTDMTFVIEGSLFWKGFEYKKTVEEALEKLTDYKAEFVEVKDSGIIGAAHLVM